MPLSTNFLLEFRTVVCFVSHFLIFITLLGDRPFNLKRGGYGFLFRSEFFFWTTQELEYLFFCRAKREFFFQKLTLGYITKNLNQIIIFSSTKIRIFFSATLGINIFFRKKNITPPPPLKLNDRSLRSIID